MVEGRRRRSHGGRLKTLNKPCTGTAIMLYRLHINLILNPYKYEEAASLRSLLTCTPIGTFSLTQCLRKQRSRVVSIHS